MKTAGKKFVVLSCDRHNAWFNKLTLVDGTQFGAEFAGMAVTTPGFERVFPPAVISPANLAATIRSTRTLCAGGLSSRAAPESAVRNNPELP